MNSTLLFLGFVALLFLLGFALHRMWRGDNGNEAYRERVHTAYDADQDGPRDEEAW